jgi:predicted dehydrogenase
MKPILRAGIVGGGRGAFIGTIHRRAAELDGEARLVAGAMSSDSATARRSAADWSLDRSYDSYEEMARAEAARTDGIDFVIVATPNHLHVPMSRTFLQAGIHVICDKPLARNVAEGQALAALVASGRPLFALTHNYSGYPAVRHARELVRTGELGSLRRVMVEYTQDWLMEPLERSGNRQASWRVDPARAGPGGSLGDIGTHAAHLLEFVSGQQIEGLCADLSRFVDGRELDDDASVLLRMKGGGRGTLVCSQIACGEANRLSLRLYGTKAGLEWHQEDPNTLIFKPAGQPWISLRVGAGRMSAAAGAMIRTPAGHPEGFIEAFANIYRLFYADIRRLRDQLAPLRDYPTAADGVRGLRFVAAAVQSASAGSTWQSV